MRANLAVPAACIAVALTGLSGVLPPLPRAVEGLHQVSRRVMSGPETAPVNAPTSLRAGCRSMDASRPSVWSRLVSRAFPRPMVAAAEGVAGTRGVKSHRAPAPPPGSSKADRADLKRAMADFDSTRALGHIQQLADHIGPRPLGSPQEALAAKYIAGSLGARGWKTQVQDGIRLDGTDLKTRNVIATHPATRGDAPWIVVLGAHYDSCVLTERSPGANDNGSGVAVLLELARVVKGNRLPYELRLAFFGGEERTPEQPEIHHVGSDAYVSSLSAEERSRVLAMLSVDMVGAGKRLSVSRLGYGSDAAMQWVLEAASGLGLSVGIGASEAWSDHEAFELAGIPSAWLTTMESAPYWHTTQDRTVHIGRNALTLAGRLTIRFLYSVANSVQGAAGPK